MSEMDKNGIGQFGMEKEDEMKDEKGDFHP